MQNPARRDEEGPETIHVLVEGLIDYAGLFPPAKLSMAAAVGNYAKYVASPDGWMLGRFILPATRIAEFAAASRDLLPICRFPDEPRGGDPWPISAIIDGDLDDNLDAIFAFNHAHENPEQGMAVIDAIELKVPVSGSGNTGAAWIDDTIELLPDADAVFPFFEIPMLAPPGAGSSPPDFRGMIAALAGVDGAAKLRTGGVSADAIPAAAAVAEFIVACDAAEVPFKATAGLHHAFRAHYPLTYEADAPKGLMHGFMNVFLAATLIHARRGNVEGATRLLEELDPSAFKFSRDGVMCRTLGVGLELAQVGRAREQFALSYGSCSFEEPVEELKKLGLV